MEQVQSKRDGRAAEPVRARIQQFISQNPVADHPGRQHRVTKREAISGHLR